PMRTRAPALRARNAATALRTRPPAARMRPRAGAMRALSLTSRSREACAFRVRLEFGLRALLPQANFTAERIPHVRARNLCDLGRGRSRWRYRRWCRGRDLERLRWRSLDRR